MSIADAVRARELEARVAALEQRMAVLESGNSPHLAQRINLLQGQVNALRYRPSGDPVKTDDAA
jgi:hypothetical protein